MMGHKFGTFLTTSTAIALALALSAPPVLCADAKPKAAASASAEPHAQASPAKKKTLRERAKSALHKINPARLLRDREYKKASAVFPSFCKDWEHKLHEREVNNLNHVAWTEKDGYETGTYTGYSPVEKCECHQSADGYSIGKVTYEEFMYYVTGKTKDEAEHAKPQVTETTTTTELFRWDKGKWFY